MALAPNLDTRLAELQLDVANFAVLEKLTREHERRIMAHAYLWWREAVTVPGYLETCYEHNHITFNKTRGVNFRPLLRLVHDNRIQDTDLDLWTKALRRIHDEFEKYPDHYATEPVEALCHFVKLNGGKAGLAGYHGTQTDDDELIEDAPLPLFDLNEAELIPVLRDEARKFYAQSQHRPSIDMPALHTSDAGYSVVVMHKHSGKVTLVGTSNDNTLIDEALIKTYRDDFTAQPITVRSVLEPLHVLNVPRSIAHAYDKLAEKSRIKDPWAAKPKAMLAHRRLIYRADTADFLLSLTGVDSSVVLTSRPKKAVMDKRKGDMFLMESARQSIERRLLHQSTFNLFRASSDQKFHRVPAGFIAAQYVKLDTKLILDGKDGVTANQILAVTKNLSHPPLSFIPFYESMGTPTWQVTNRNDAFAAMWTAQISLDWLRETTTEFVGKWVKNRGDKANRDLNRTMSLGLDKNALIIGFDLDTGVGYSQTRTLALPVKQFNQFMCVTVRSADLMFTLRQIADLNIMGDIDLAIDSGALRLQFETDANSFECWIPTADDAGTRHTQCFEPYNPVQTEGLETSKDPDDLVPDPTEAENQQLLENMKRLRK